MNLVFVYNADSGVFNSLTDIAHKIISPDTYQCNLCNLTHGYFKARQEWVKFLSDLDADIEFLHRDEFLQKYPSYNQLTNRFPAIFIQQDTGLKLWMGSEIINRMMSTKELMQAIHNELSAAQPTS